MKVCPYKDRPLPVLGLKHSMSSEGILVTSRSSVQSFIFVTSVVTHPGFILRLCGVTEALQDFTPPTPDVTDLT